MTIDKVVSFFQVCHSTDQPLCKQCQREIAAKKECKEANQEKDAADKKRAAARRNNSSRTNNKNLTSIVEQITSVATAKQMVTT